MSSPPYMIVVDDDRELAEIARFCGEEQGFEVGLAKNGKEFQRAMEKRLPDVIVLDLVMPEIEGTELISWMIQKELFAPVILMSGFDDLYIKSARMLGEKGGVKILGELKKPFSLTDLELLLAQVHGHQLASSDRKAG